MLSKPALDKRTTQDRRARQTDGVEEKQNSHQYLLLPNSNHFDSGAYCICGIMRLPLIIVSDTLKPANTLSTPLTAATREVNIVGSQSSACCVNSPGVFS